MEPVSLGTLAKMVMILISALSIANDVDNSRRLDQQSAHYQRIADAYVQVVKEHYNNNPDELAFVIEMERARQIRRAIIDAADISADMAQNSRLDAATTAIIDTLLAGNPGGKIGGLVGPRQQVYGQIGDIAASAYSTQDTASNLMIKFNPGAPIDENLRNQVAAILGQDEDNLTNAILGARLCWTRTKWLELNEQFWDDPDGLDRAFDQVLDDIVRRVQEHTPQLVGAGRRFTNVDELKAYLREHVELMEPPAGLVPVDAFEDETTGDDGDASSPDEPPSDDAFADETAGDDGDASLPDEPPPDDAFAEESFGPLPLTPDLTYLMNDAFYADYDCQTENVASSMVRLAWNGTNFTLGDPDAAAENVLELPLEALGLPDMDEHEPFLWGSGFRLAAPSIWLPLDGGVYTIPQEVKQDTADHYVGYVEVFTELRLQSSPDTQMILGDALATTLYQGSYTRDFVDDDREGNAFSVGYQQVTDEVTFRAWYDNATGLVVRSHLTEDNTVCYEEGDSIGDVCPKNDGFAQCTLVGTSLPITD